MKRLFFITGILLALGVPVCAGLTWQPPNTPPQVKLQRGMNGGGGSAGPHARSISTAENKLEQAFVLRKKLTQRDLQAAVRLFTASAQRFRSSGAPERAAYAELEAGDTYVMMSGYQQALRAYRRSLELAANHSERRCAAFSHIGRVYATIGQTHRAVLYSDLAVALCESGPDKKALAGALEAQGEARFWSGDMAGAEAPFNRARRIFSESNDYAGEALATMMLAESINAGNRNESGRLARTALNLWEKAGDQYGAARAHAVLAFFASAAGKFGLAQCHSTRALQSFESIADKDNEAIVSNILGMVYRQSGDMNKAKNNYDRARRDFAAVYDILGEAESISGMGAALEMEHNYRELLRLYRQKLQLGEKAGNSALVASALLDMAGVYLYKRRYDQADANIHQALAKYRAVGNRYGEGNALTQLANLRAKQGRNQEALELFDQARALKEQTGQIEDLARIQYNCAGIYRRLGRLDEARTQIEKTIAIIESQRLRLYKFDSRAQYFASVHEYYSLYIQVLMALHQLHPDREYMRLAFEAAERSKVRALLDLLENPQQDTPCDELLAADSDPSASSGVAEKKAAKLDVTSSQPLTLPEIQVEIGDGDTLLLEYALGDEKSFVWLLDGKSISAHELPSAAQIGRSARAFRKALIPPVRGSNETTTEYLQRRQRAADRELSYSRKLGKLLFGALDLPPGKHLLVVPDGPLQYVPFAAFSIAGRGVNTAPLITQHDVTMLPSASVLVALRKKAPERHAPTDEVAIFADPVFGNADKRAPAHSVRGASDQPPELIQATRDIGVSGQIPRLPGSRAEALGIQQIVGPNHARLFVGYDATRQSVMKGSLANYWIIHFATHGLVDTVNPEMSGLILSLVTRQGKPQDGYLRLSDIYSLKLSADLVVLSSCESALGKDLESEGIIGLPRGFLYAGARRVIASLWKVEDDATAALMRDLYSRLQKGESPQAALRESQLELAKDWRYRQPYYWAAFVLEGDYRWQTGSSEKVENGH